MFTPTQRSSALFLLATGLIAGGTIARAHGPTGATFVAPLPNITLQSSVVFATLIGPPVGSTIAHATLDVFWESNGVFPASDVEFEFEMFVDGGVHKSWIVSGADLGFGAGAGVFTGTLDTDVFNGVAWHFLGPDAIIDFTIGTVSGTGGVTGRLSNSSLTFDLGTAWESYCTAGTSASGCQAQISASGLSSATAPSGFFLAASGVEGQKDGLFFFGTNGRQAAPWGNGTSYQCVVPPVSRCGLLAGSGTAGACDDSFSQDLNARWTAKPSQNPGPGVLVQAQLWYRDPFSTSNQPTSLSDAIEFPVAP
jgi:hypothetical protein